MNIRIKPFKPRVVFDSSILKSIGYDGKSLEYKYLSKLCKSHSIKIMAPEIVIWECASHIHEGHLDNLKKIESAINYLKRKSSYGKEVDISKIFNSKISAKSFNHIEFIESAAIEHSKQSFNHRKEYICEIFSLEKIKITPNDVFKVFENYFHGEGNFAQPKNRKDIPDGFVLAGIEDEYERCKRENGTLICIIADDGLTKALQNYPDLIILNSISDLIAELHKNNIGSDEFRTWVNSHDIIIQKLKKQSKPIITAAIQLIQEELLVHGFYHPEIPNEDGCSEVESLDKSAVTIKWDSSEIVGEGLIRLPIFFSAVARICFSVNNSQSANSLFRSSNIQYASIQIGDGDITGYDDKKINCSADFLVYFKDDSFENIEQLNTFNDNLSYDIHQLEVLELIDIFPPTCRGHTRIL